MKVNPPHTPPLSCLGDRLLITPQVETIQFTKQDKYLPDLDVTGKPFRPRIENTGGGARFMLKWPERKLPDLVLTRLQEYRHNQNPLFDAEFTISDDVSSQIYILQASDGYFEFHESGGTIYPGNFQVKATCSQLQTDDEFETVYLNFCFKNLIGKRIIRSRHLDGNFWLKYLLDFFRNKGHPIGRIMAHWTPAVDCLSENYAIFKKFSSPPHNQNPILAAQATWTAKTAAKLGFTRIKRVYTLKPDTNEEAVFCWIERE